MSLEELFVDSAEVKKSSAEVSTESQIFNRPKRAKKASNHRFKRLVVVGDGASGEENIFEQRLAETNQTLVKSKIDILQINLGKMCNLTCGHCHVEAGPDRTEIITDESIDQLILPVVLPRCVLDLRRVFALFVSWGVRLSFAPI